MKILGTDVRAALTGSKGIMFYAQFENSSLSVLKFVKIREFYKQF